MLQRSSSVRAPNQVLIADIPSSESAPQSEVNSFAGEGDEDTSGEDVANRDEHDVANSSGDDHESLDNERSERVNPATDDDDATSTHAPLIRRISSSLMLSLGVHTEPLDSARLVEDRLRSRALVMDLVAHGEVGNNRGDRGNIAEGGDEIDTRLVLLKRYTLPATRAEILLLLIIYCV